MTNYPDDADGAVLADLAASGIEMSKPLDIEFSVAATGEKSARKILDVLTKKGYEAEIVYDEGEPDDDGEIDPDDEEFGPSWTVVVNVRMVPEYTDIVRIQSELDGLTKSLGGTCDGWGVMLDG